MGNYGWILAPLLIGVMVSCASKDIAGIDGSTIPNTLGETGQIAGQLSVSSLNGEGEFRVREEIANGTQLVWVIADAPVTTTALLLEVTYDAGAYNPLVVHLAEKLLELPNALTLEPLQTPGKVGVGVVLTGGKQIELCQDETVVQIMFGPAGTPTDKLQKSTSAVPANANAVVPLIWDEATGELLWYMVNPGDYDQNSEVGLSDLVPLAIHFGETGPFDYRQIQAVVDGSGDGEINLQDITTIALGYGNTVQGYNLYASDNIADIPQGYTELSVIEPLATFPLNEAANTGLGERLRFAFSPTPEQQGLMFWARPFETSVTGVVSEGTRSNINGPTISQNPDPGGPDFNFSPVASLSLDFLGSNVPLDVLLDGSGSNDPDGDIVFYEWDFEGDGLVDAYSTNPVISHTYNNPGTYSPTLIVTDNHGARDTFASPPFTATREEITNIEPFADLYATVYSGATPLTVGLIASGSSDVDGYIAKYEWDFDGDGTVDLDSGMDPTVMHTYDGHGVFACRVTVTDDAGASAFAEVEIEAFLNKPPTAVLTANPAFGDDGEKLTLDASMSRDFYGNFDNISLYEFDFEEDGIYDGYGEVSTVDHVFPGQGVYQAKVRVTDLVGMRDVATVELRINEVFPSSLAWPSFGGNPRNTRRSPNVGAQTNIVKWTFDSEGSIVGCPAIGSDGTIYFGSSDKKFYAVNPNGTEKWSYLTGSWAFSSAAIGVDGTVYFGSGDTNLYALNPDGSLRWSNKTNSQGNSSPVIGSDRTIYIGSKPTGKLNAINSSGSLIWSYTTGDDVSSSPAIGFDGTVYIGSWDKHLYAINPDGSLKWSYDVGYKLESAPSIGTGGTVYIPVYNGGLLAINADGTEKWHRRGYGGRSSSAIGADGTIFWGSRRGLYGFTADALVASGNWPFSTGSSTVYSTPAIGEDGTLYFGCDNGNFYAVNPDGTLKWEHAMGSIVRSSPAIGADGTVYVGSNDGKLYAFGE